MVPVLSTFHKIQKPPSQLFSTVIHYTVFKFVLEEKSEKKKKSRFWKNSAMQDENYAIQLQLR